MSQSPRPMSLPEHDPVADLEHFLTFARGAATSWQNEFARAQGALQRLQATTSAGSWLDIENLSADLTRSILPHVVQATRGAVRSYVMELDGGPAGAPEVSRAASEGARSGRPMWTLYPSVMFATDEGIEMTRRRAADGEIQRVCPATQTQFIVVGDELVVSAAVWGDPSQGYVLIRHPLVVAAFRAYFDASWNAAQSLTRAPDLGLDDERLLELLGYGLKDEAIARIMGLGLRTVRRRIAVLMAGYGVETRFQLGAALARAGRTRPAAQP